MTSIRIGFAAVVAASLAAPLAAPLSAQGTCEVEVRKPYQLASAILYLQKHDQSAIDGDRAKHIKAGVKVLTDDPGRIKNETGRNFLLGQFFVRWYQDGGRTPPLRATRGDLGFSENPEGEFFLPDALDAAMGIVERELPACADSTARYRNAVFSRVLNSAIAFYNSKGYDSAVVYANYALKVNPRSPQVGGAYQVIANSSQAKGDLGMAISSLEAALARMGSDSAAVASRASATFNLGVLMRDQALTQQGEAKNAGLRRAAALFKSYLDLTPEGENATAARGAYARSLQDAGDMAAVEGIYSDMIANPAAYTALQLFEAGVVEANAKKWADAATLYVAGLKKNPWYRDALFNLSNVYFAQHLPDLMAPVVEKLRAVDPMNPDVLKLAGAVWQERGRLTTDPKVKKMSQDSVIAYVERSQKMPVRVSVTQFQLARDGKVTLTGIFENLGDASAAYSAKFELLDAAGAVVAAVDAKTDQVAPKSAREFSAQVVAAGAVAWRYTMQ